MSHSILRWLLQWAGEGAGGQRRVFWTIVLPMWVRSRGGREGRQRGGEEEREWTEWKLCDSEHQSDVMYGNYSVSERDWEQGVGFNLLGASLIPRFVTLASMVEFSPGIHDGMGRIERVCWESLNLSWWRRPMNCHSLGRTLSSCMISCHVTFTPSHSSSHTNIFTYTPYYTTLIFTYPHSLPCTFSLTTPSLPLHILITPSLPHTHSSHTLTTFTVWDACEALIFETWHEVT